MDTAKETLKKDIQLLASQLETVRDEIRIQIHLASLDARDAWRKLEPDVERARSLAQQTSKSSLAAIEDALKRGLALLRSLRDEAEAARHAHP